MLGAPKDSILASISRLPPRGYIAVAIVIVVVLVRIPSSTLRLHVSPSQNVSPASFLSRVPRPRELTPSRRSSLHNG